MIVPILIYGANPSVLASVRQEGRLRRQRKTQVDVLKGRPYLTPLSFPLAVLAASFRLRL